MTHRIDAIVYVENFPVLVAHLNQNAPETLAHNEDGSLTLPPNVNAFTRTPAETKGDSLLTYCRFTEAQAAEWRGTPGVEILGEAPWVYGVPGTADAIFEQIFSDPEKLAKYDSVYNRFPVHIDEATGEEVVQQRDHIGIMSGA